MKKTRRLVVTMLLLLSLGIPMSVRAAEGGKTIGFVSISDSLEHCTKMRNAIQDVVTEHGDTLRSADGAFDVAKTNTAVEDFIAAQVDAILIDGLDSQGHIGVIRQAGEAGIPVVQFDNWCDDKEITIGQCASDNYDAGVKCAEDAIKRLQESGKDLAEAKAFVLESPGSPAPMDRIAGFETTFTEAGGTIAGRANADGVELALAAVEDLLQATPDVDVIMCYNDADALGSHSALKTAGTLDQVLIYGCDGDAENLKLIQAGEIAGTVAQDPAEMGRVAVNMVYSYWAGEEFETEVHIPVQFINSENVADFLEAE